MTVQDPKPTEAAPKVANERPKYAPTGGGPMGRGGPMGMGGGTGEKAVAFGASLKRLLGMLRPERVKMVLVVVLASIAVALSVAGPKILAGATDLLFAGVLGRQLPGGMTKDQLIQTLTAQGKTDLANMLSRLPVVPGQGVDFGALGSILLLTLAVYLASGGMQWITGYLVNGITQRTVYRMRKQVSEKLDRLPLSYFDNAPRGELLSRVTNDIDNIAQTLQQTMSQFINNLLTVVGVIGMMLWISPLLTVVALITIPVVGVVTGIIGKTSQKRFKQMWKSTGELNGIVEEAYTGHSLVKVFGRQREVAEQFAVKNNDLFKSAFGAQFVSGIIMPAVFFIGNLNYVAIAVIGGLRIASGQMGLGDVQAFIQYSRMFTQPLTQLASVANLLQSGIASAERVFEVLDAQEQTPDAEGQLPTPLKGRVAFEHVQFSYNLDKPLITDLSLVAEPGATIAIVGPTGAGKTTLVNLLERFYDIQGGEITLDGVDINAVPRRELRDQMGMVLQDTWLFGGSIRDNIAYGKPGATEAEIRAAAEASYVDRFVHSLPDGYDTVIDEEGSNVSAGEKQLITIARAFLSEPTILILDEATSSVDTRTELLVQRAMKALRADRTSFVIAHRLSTIRDADTILVMEHGDIVEQGNHEQLMAAKGAYYRLYQAQFAATLQGETEAEDPAA
ncbi:MAG: ABC transporter ATP-binding protein [Micropruina sp.]|nr:ABC transporter ATP-binding protein [Micropruina sp.]